MKFLIISGNPKTDGLCMSVQKEIERGAREAGAEVRVMTVEKLDRCRVCANGWGICREEHRCAFGSDGFDEAQAAVREADIYCIITPVYWSDMSESLKCFLDRLRRCEYGASGAMSEKPVLLVASPGGSGDGVINCMNQLDRFCKNMNAAIFDYIGINRRSAEYKRQAAYEAAKAMVINSNN